ncbi:MAG: hypothetical protein ACJ789_21235 [Thermomicrobiales bacterium]
MSATTAPAKPQVLAPNPAGIPAELRERRQWVGFRLELVTQRDGRQKWTKVPYNARTGAKASTIDPATWSSLAELLANMERFGFDGIGYVFSADDPYCGVDFDGCVGEAGLINEHVQAELGDLATYTEWSCSKTGIHAIAAAAISRAGKKPHIEMYNQGRFFVVTGHRLDGTPATIAARQAVIDALHLRHFGPEPSKPPEPNSHHRHDELPDGEIIRLATEAANGDKFRRLFFNGDTSGYPSQSEADAALCLMFAFWTARNSAQMDRCFRRSALMRDKWDTKHYGDGRTYGAATIDHVCENTTETYTSPWEGHGPTVNTTKTSNHRLATHEMPWPVLDDAALYGLAGEVVDIIDAHTEAAKIATLGTFLVMFGNAVGRTPHLQIGSDRHGLNEFIALVGDTAKARKGSSRGGPQRLLTSADPQWGEERVQGGLSSGEGLLAAIADPITRTNKQGELEVIFEGSKDKRLTCIEEELSQLLKVAGRQGNIISEIVRRGWDSRDSLRTMTKSSPLTVTGPHISIIGHITAGELRRELDDTARANGFGNRFLWLCAERSKAEPFLEPIPDETVAKLGRRIRGALDHARRTTRVQFDDEAKGMWREIYPDLSDGKPGLVGSLIARAEAHALRVALAYALLDGASAIGGAHLLAALAVIDYAEASALYIFGDATGDSIADRILAALRSTGAMTQNDIYEFFGRHVSSNRIGLALETLVRAHLVRSTQDKETGGRPRTVWEATA